jgi:hypothetical protein
MKNLFIVAVLVSFLLMPAMAGAQGGRQSAGPPPVKQTLIPEGFFAIKLADALKLGPVKTEAEAETTLTSLGITPRNGWIADYPVTPDVLIELQDTASMAADSGNLAMDRDEATNVVQGVATDLGLPVVTAGDQGGQTGSTEDYGEYSDPSVVDNYYNDEGPPVVTYYPPPPDYDYLYAWVPSPFWSFGFFFPGFFVLNDFDTLIIINKKQVRCTNHVINPKTHRIASINPEARTIGRNVSSNSNLTGRGSNTIQGKNGASAVFNRSVEKSSTADRGRGVVSRTNVPTATSTINRPAGTGSETGLFSRSRAPVYHEAPARMPPSSGRVYSPPSSTGQGSSGGKSFEGSHGGGSPFGGFSRSHGGCRGRC